MDTEEKIKIILERIAIIDYHIELNQSNINEGYQNKEGLPSFEFLIEDFVIKKQALLKTLDDLQ